MLESGVELLTLIDGVNYKPTFVSTDHRRPVGAPTSLGYMQIGELQQYGLAKGPIFKIEIVDVSGVSADYIQIWGIDNADDNTAPIYPLTYFVNNPTITVYLKKFKFCSSDGTPAFPVSPAETYTIVGYKKKSLGVNY